MDLPDWLILVISSVSLALSAWTLRRQRAQRARIEEAERLLEQIQELQRLTATSLLEH